MQTLMIELISKYGYLAITFLITVENIFPPIPSEVILTFSGFISKSANLNLLIIIIFSTLGSLLGAILLYGIGYFVGEKRIITLVNSKIGVILRFKESNVRNSILCFKEKGGSSIFFCRFVPIVRSLISIPAGISKYNFWVFIFLTTIGSLIWNSIFILLGNIFGENWPIIANFMEKYSKLIFIIILVIYLVIHFRRKKKIHTILDT